MASTPQVRKRAKRPHDGKITVTVPDKLWATDATDGHTDAGRCAVFVMIDHASGEAWADAGHRLQSLIVSTASRTASPRLSDARRS